MDFNNDDFWGKPRRDPLEPPPLPPQPLERGMRSEPLDAEKVFAVPGDEFWVLEKDEVKGHVKKCLSRSQGGGWFSTSSKLGRYRILDPRDPDFKKTADMVKDGKFASAQEERAVGSFVSMAIGDALGAPMEFNAVTYDDDRASRITGMTQSFHFGLRPGMWTDDASMGACIADSLLWCGGFDPYDTKVRFICWWENGYNNAFRNLEKPKHSVGLGGNISMSFSEFSKNGRVFTFVGDKNTSGNGSLMRNGAIACYYHDDVETAMEVARRQSYLTHQGIEAAEACALLTFICHRAINNPELGVKGVLEDLSDFKTDCDSVKCLANSEWEPGNNPERNWNWKNPQHRYAPGRAAKMPGYVGSYAMDNLAMSLHCVYNTTNYPDALLRAANRCGDADSVCDVTGQIAGAIYGFNAIPKDWLEAVNQWDDNDFAVKGVKMFRKLPARYPKETYGDEVPDASAVPLPADDDNSASAFDSSSDGGMGPVVSDLGDDSQGGETAGGKKDSSTQ